jgi:hypothetical protein
MPVRLFPQLPCPCGYFPNCHARAAISPIAMPVWLFLQLPGHVLLYLQSRSTTTARSLPPRRRYEEEMLQFHYEPNADRRVEILRDAALRRGWTAETSAQAAPPHAPQMQQQQAETQTAHALAQPAETQTSESPVLQAETQTLVSPGLQAETQTLVSPGLQAETQTFLATGEEGTQTLAAAAVADASVQHRPVLSTLA